jgi:hypothetical protein
VELAPGERGHLTEPGDRRDLSARGRPAVEVGALDACSDGTTSFAVRGMGTRQLTNPELTTLLDQVYATLVGQGATVYVMGAAAFLCSDSSRPTPYLYFLQLDDWAWADAAVQALGTVLTQGDASTTVGVSVGAPVNCAS